MERYDLINKSLFLILPHVLLTTTLNSIAETPGNQQYYLEEITTTAQKREQSLQETPIAISVLTQEQMQLQGFNELGAILKGAIPSLHVIPMGNSPSNLALSIRGNTVKDTSEVLREASVGIYLDGVYIARSQGMGVELIDLERIEVLRGPQGSLFGRNAVGGAVNLISKKPTGEFGINQAVTLGRFNELRSVTRINFPEISGVRAKLDYIHSERNGWVNNTASGEEDYTAYNKDGGRFSLSWQASDVLSFDYSYDQSNIEAAQNYYQFYVDRLGYFGEERKRLTETRLPATDLSPTVSKLKGHTLTASWSLTEQVLFKSISSYRDLKDDNDNNFLGVLYYNGFGEVSTTKQNQYTQELQLIGTQEKFEWVTGLYYLKEDVDRTSVAKFTLDIFGDFGQPFDPPIYDTPKVISAEAESQAVYGQITWNVNKNLDLTLGGRYTEDERDATRFISSLDSAKQDSDNFDTTAILNYHWNENISTYLKWSTAYKAGGVNTRSASFAPFGEEQATTSELGIKSEFLDRRARLNLAIFNAHYEDLQMDFNDPSDVAITETVNTKNTVKVRGLEVDLTALLLPRLTIGLSYVYLDDVMPLQPNPLNTDELTRFYLALAPRHSGAMTIDYEFQPTDYGVFSAHLDITSTDHYSYTAYGEQRTDGYTLLNGRLTFGDVKLSPNSGALKISVWGENLTDEEYIIDAFAIGDPAISIGQAFGEPRTYGIDVVYDF